jgi:hypothetical protein
MKRTIEAIQRALRTDGYYQGEIDGDFGRNSRAALDAAIAAANAPVANPAVAVKPQPELHTIRIVRDRQTPRSTTSTYTAGRVNGFMLEPPGPSTTQSGQRKRIPVGTYRIVWHDGARYRGVVRLFNNEVPQSRAILIHAGNYPRDTDGCLLVGKTRTVDMIGMSRPAVSELMDWIRERGIENVRVVIEEQF